MHISKEVLHQYLDLPQDSNALRLLLDDVGIEVKKMNQEEGTISVELLANRGDHYCYEGIARECSGRLGGEVRLPEFTRLEVGEAGPKVENRTEKCLVDTATYLERNEAEKAFPEDILKPLEGAGIHSLIPPVDATNLSNIELGQPTHVFDAEKVVDPIVIRISEKGEKAWLLFEEAAREIPEGIMVIADQEKIIAIAGVIGCEDSKTTEKTRKIILESACFDPVSVRKAGRALGVHTDSLARFERGSDPTYPLIGAGRVIHLLEKYSSWVRAGQTQKVGDWKNPHRKLSISVPVLNQFLQLQLSEKEVQERLERYKFAINATNENLVIEVPPHRLWDVDKVADIYEEVAKSVGYNNTPISLPNISMGALPTLAESRREQVEELLLGAGFYEIITDGFYGRHTFEHLGLPQDHVLQTHVETLNSLEKGYSLLKNNAVLQAVEAVVKNLNKGILNLKIYEWTRLFFLDSEAENGVCSEKKILWGLTSGSMRSQTWQERPVKSDPLFLKGLVEELGIELRLDFSVHPSKGEHSVSALLHPRRQAAIYLGEQLVGVLGELHPRICKEFKIKRARPCYFEISEEAFWQESSAVQYALPPVHQPLVRTIAFGLPHKIEAIKISNVLKTSGAQVQINDRFDYQDNGQFMRAITYQLRFDNPDGTLSADSCNQVLQDLIHQVGETFGDLGVVHR